MPEGGAVTVGWLERFPGALRSFALAMCAGLVAYAAARSGAPVHWGTAIIYGTTLAVSMRWPIVMQGTGVLVVLNSGMLLEALWHHGLGTAVMAMLVEFGVRMVVLYQGRYYWEWRRPLLAIGCFVAAFGLQRLVQGPAVPFDHGMWPHFETWAFTMSYVFWILLNASWSSFKARGVFALRSADMVGAAGVCADGLAR